MASNTQQKPPCSPNIPAAGASLRIIIIGAGIAGLAAATGLRRAGHDVVIFEQSSLVHEIGAAIHVPPNSSRVLLPWGFDRERARQVVNRSTWVARADTLETIVYTDYRKFESTYSAPWLLSHRVDLHNELKYLATQEEGPGKPVEIKLKAKVVEIDPALGIVVLNDASSHSADLIVAADGVHSMAVSLVTGHDTPAIPTGFSAFRSLIPTEKLLADDRTKELLGEGGKIFAGDGHRRLVLYPCRAGELQNLVGIHPDNDKLASREAWNVRAETSDVLNEFKDFHPSLLAACGKADDVMLWKLLYREPISNWYNQRLLLIGDAAHPMLPHQGQGGAQAIEDAAALEILFSRLPPSPTPAHLSATLATRLHALESVRKNRASLMQIYSNAAQDQVDQTREQAWKFLKPDERVPANPAEFMEFNFRHDVVAECKVALERLG